MISSDRGMTVAVKTKAAVHVSSSASFNPHQQSPAFCYFSPTVKGLPPAGRPLHTRAHKSKPSFFSFTLAFDPKVDLHLMFRVKSDFLLYFHYRKSCVSFCLRIYARWVPFFH